MGDFFTSWILNRVLYNVYMKDPFQLRNLGTKDLIYNRETCETNWDRNIRSLMNQFRDLDVESLASKLPDGAVIACGGDGTLIEAFRRYGSRPILGINFGSRGFMMTDIWAVKKAKKFTIQKRSTLEIHLPTGIFSAINEISIKSTTGHIVELECNLSGHAFFLKADGCIVSTASGSTAYNNSLGGPILLDDRDFCFTPIASLSPRAMNPIVFSSERQESLRFSHLRDTDIVIHADSRDIFRWNTRELEKIVISKGVYPLHLLIPENIKPRLPFEIFTF